MYGAIIKKFKGIWFFIVFFQVSQGLLATIVAVFLFFGKSRPRALIMCVLVNKYQCSKGAFSKT